MEVRVEKHMNLKPSPIKYLSILTSGTNTENYCYCYARAGNGWDVGKHARGPGVITCGLYYSE